MPWYHQLALLDKLKTREERVWYAAKAIEHGWSRNVMWHHISTRLQQREGKAVTNFDQRLPALDSELAHQTLKDPYPLPVSLTPDAFPGHQLQSR